MRKNNCLLSKRFAADGKANGYLTKTTSKVVDAIRKEIVSGRLERRTHDKCPLCSHSEAYLVARKDRSGLPVDTVVCENCGLVFSDKYFSDSAAGIYYGKYCNQLKNGGRTAEEMFLSRTAPTAYSWRRYNWVKDRLGSEFDQVKIVMEIGCNDGCNLFPYHQNGIKVYGCDFDEERMNAGRKRGLELHAGGVEKLQDLGLKADLIIFSHALEHMPDVDQALQKALSVLAEGGMIYVEVPGLKYWNRQNKDRVSDDWIRSTNNFLGYLQLEHNYHFEWYTLSCFAERNGLKALHWDEFVHALFRNDLADQGAGGTKKMHGNVVLSYLNELENDWARSNPLWKRVARNIKRSVLTLKR